MSVLRIYTGRANVSADAKLVTTNVSGLSGSP